MIHSFNYVRVKKTIERIVMNISFAYLFKETFRAFFRNFKYSAKIIAIWLFPMVLLSGVVSKFIMDLETLSYLSIALNIYIYYVCYLILLPLIIQKTAFDRELGMTVPLSVQFSLFIKYIKIILSVILVCLPGLLLVGGLVWGRDILSVRIVLTLLGVLYGMGAFYIAFKLNFVLVNIFDTDVSILQILKIKFGFKNALKSVGANIVALLVFLVPMLIIWSPIAFGGMFLERVFDNYVLGFDIHDVAYIPFLSNFFMSALYTGFSTAFVMGFYAVFYKQYIQGRV